MRLETVWSAEIDEFLVGGLFLGDLGIRNWALTKSQALAAIDGLEALGIGIPGGDVYRMDSGRLLVSTYDNWYCDSQTSEGGTEFAHRSAEAARGCITSFGSSSVLFAIVPRVREGRS